MLLRILQSGLKHFRLRFSRGCGEPKVSTNVVVTPPKGYSDTTLWLDGVAYTGELRNGNLIVTAPDGKAKPRSL